MPHSKPFAWLLAVGMICSLAGLAFSRWPETTSAAEQDSVPSTSAHPNDSSGASNAVPTVVTEASPSAVATGTSDADTDSAAPSTQIAQAVATPTPVLIAPSAEATTQSIPANVHQAVEVQRAPDQARGLLDRMNEARLEAGLPALEWDASLEAVAYARASNLVENGYFDHYAPDGESAFSELAARGIRYRLAGENLARNNYLEAKTVAAAFDGLMNSPGHRANILEERFSSVAVACVRDGKMWVYVTVFLN